MLEVGDGILTAEFLVGDGVLTMPAEEDVDFPVLELEVVVVLHGIAGAYVFVVNAPAVVVFLAGGLEVGHAAVKVVAVTGGHIEIGAGEVALVLVLGFPDVVCLAEAFVVALPYLEGAGSLGGVGDVAEGIVGAGAIGGAVGGVEVVAVLVGVVLCPTPPRLGETVLHVAAGDDFPGRGEGFPVVAVHIHTEAGGGVAVGIVEDVPGAVGAAAVGDDGAGTDDEAQGAFEGGVAKTVDAVVVAGGDGFGKEREGKEKQKPNPEGGKPHPDAAAYGTAPPLPL